MPLGVVVRDRPHLLLISPEGNDAGIMRDILVRGGADVTVSTPEDVPVRLSFLGMNLTLRCDMSPRCVYCNQRPADQRMTAEDWKALVRDVGAQEGEGPYLYLTGGEPLLQLDAALIEAVHALGMEIAVETNGTRPAPPGIDWLCVSPKAGAPLVLLAGDELKLVYPQAEAPPERFAGLAFHDFYLQPMDGPLRYGDTGRDGVSWGGAPADYPQRVAQVTGLSASKAITTEFKVNGQSGTQTKPGPAIGGKTKVELGVNGNGEPVRLADRLAADHLDRHIQVAHQPQHDLQLLPVLLAKIGPVRHRHPEELGHHRSHPVKMAGPRGALQWLGHT